MKPQSKDDGFKRFYNSLMSRWSDTINRHYSWDQTVHEVTVTGLKFKWRSTDVLIVLTGQDDGGNDRVAFLSGSDFFDCVMTLFEQIDNRSIEWRAPKKWE